MFVGTVDLCLVAITLIFFQLLWHKEGLHLTHLWLLVVKIAYAFWKQLLLFAYLTYILIIIFNEILIIPPRIFKEVDFTYRGTLNAYFTK